MITKPKVAICWLGGCGGCDETIVDINETILDIVKEIELIIWPIALDYKYDHIEKMNDGEITLSVVNGNIRNSEQEEIARLLRQKSRLMLAFGSCACFGGTPGLANLFTREDILNWVYRDAPTVVNPNSNYPATRFSSDGMELTLPELYDRVYSLDQLIEIDYYLPGCPPAPNLVISSLRAVIDNKLPPHGSTLSPRRALCDTCKRNGTKPEKLSLGKINRIHMVEANPEVCFLNQGILCLGPATRSGCGETCININMPCRGCGGPVNGSKGSAGRTISAITSILEGCTEKEARQVIDQFVDPVGYIYRFSLPQSRLSKKIDGRK
jgi:F420-non-reducing hydrogenase small subunit